MGARNFEVMPAMLAALGAAGGEVDNAVGRQVSAQIEQAKCHFEQTWDRAAAIEEAVAALEAVR